MVCRSRVQPSLFVKERRLHTKEQRKSSVLNNKGNQYKSLFLLLVIKEQHGLPLSISLGDEFFQLGDVFSS